MYCLSRGTLTASPLPTNVGAANDYPTNDHHPAAETTQKECEGVIL